MAREEEDEKPLVLTPRAPVEVGDKVTVKSLEHQPRAARAPKRMTEADLLAAMQSAGKDLDEEELREAMKECSGIGTPATRAAVIEKLLDKGSPKHPKAPWWSAEEPPGPDPEGHRPDPDGPVQGPSQRGDDRPLGDRP